MTNMYCYARKSELREIVENRELRLYSSSISRYRESWDCGFEFSKEYLMNHKPSEISPLMVGELSPKDIATAKRNLNKAPYYAISFFADYFNQDLWRKYAEDGNGVVIALDAKVLSDYINKNREMKFPEGFSDRPDIRIVNVHYGYDERFLAKAMAETIKACNGEKTQAFWFLEYMGNLLNGTCSDNSLHIQKETRLIFKDWLPVMKRSESIGENERKVLRVFEMEEMSKRNNRFYKNVPFFSRVMPVL